MWEAVLVATICSAIAFSNAAPSLIQPPKIRDFSFCPKAPTYGTGPPQDCQQPSDPNNLPKSSLENWLTRDVFNDLFPFSNLGWGPSPCFPYSYESFVIAARYFPEFGTSSPNEVYKPEENYRRDVAAFFAHAIQETGENDGSAYHNGLTKEQADDCFYRGGLYNWFEGGPTSGFLNPQNPGHQPSDGNVCTAAGRYCQESAQLNFWYPCNNEQTGDSVTPYKGCYFGRGAIQISYNFNYGMFNNFLKSKGVNVDLLREPNLLMTKMDPPLAIMASLWFYMTPQPPKPAMHDIILGAWNPGEVNKQAGYEGPIFGPTSLIINNECGGEDPTDPGGPGESRRIKAFKWFTKYFGVPAGEDRLLTCKDMPQRFSDIHYMVSYEPDWSTTWKNEHCNCAPASYQGFVPYFDPAYYPDEWVKTNDAQRQICIDSIYANPSMYSLNNVSSPCLNY